MAKEQSGEAKSGQAHASPITRQTIFVHKYVTAMGLFDYLRTHGRVIEVNAYGFPADAGEISLEELEAGLLELINKRHPAERYYVPPSFHQKVKTLMETTKPAESSNIEPFENPLALSADTVKTMRVFLDAMHQAAKNDLPPGRYTSLALTALENGRMWLGSFLEAMEAPPRYGSKYDPQDTSGVPIFLTGLNYAQKFYDARKQLGRWSKDIKNWYLSAEGFEQKTALRNAYTGIEDCRMWMGVEMAVQLKAAEATRYTEEHQVEINSGDTPGKEAVNTSSS